MLINTLVYTSTKMCFPVTGQDWYVLFAVQEWNERMNSIYNAVGYTMSLVRGTWDQMMDINYISVDWHSISPLASLVDVISSLFPQPNNLHLFSQKTHFELGALIAGLIGSLFALLPFVMGMPSVILTWFASLSFLPSIAVSLAAVTTRYKSSPVVDAFSDVGFLHHLKPHLWEKKKPPSSLNSYPSLYYQSNSVVRDWLSAIRIPRCFTKRHHQPNPICSQRWD